MSKTSWDPARYSLFGDERRRPAVDLIARLPKPDDGFAPDHIVDLGCGPGDVTALLAGAFATAGHTPTITGIDTSPDMMAIARTRPESITWQQDDIATWQSPVPLDLIFSNAALNWVPDHAALIPHLTGQLRPGGLIAIQIPNNFLAPSHNMIGSAGKEWQDAVAEAQKHSRIMRPGDYFEALSVDCDAIDLWQTQYCHLLRGEDPVFDWVHSTTLRPVLAALPDDAAREIFCGRYKALMKQAYPPRPDGVTLFPFNRLFMIARKR
ncbi:MAG: methyltransferase domain-containing protein [Pseudomonadota bacterium]